MKKDSKVEFLREKNLQKAIELIKEKGKFSVLSEYSTFPSSTSLSRFSEGFTALLFDKCISQYSARIYRFS